MVKHTSVASTARLRNARKTCSESVPPLGCSTGRNTSSDIGSSSPPCNGNPVGPCPVTTLLDRALLRCASAQALRAEDGATCERYPTGSGVGPKPATGGAPVLALDPGGTD